MCVCACVCLTVIGGEDHHGVVSEPRVIQRGEQPAHLGVQVGDGGVVVLTDTQLERRFAKTTSDKGEKQSQDEPMGATLNGKWTAFTQRLSNQWPLNALYDTASHSPVHAHIHTPTASTLRQPAHQKPLG